MGKSSKTTTDEKASAKRGRVSTFTEDVAEEICARIAEGEPLRQICREDGMPAWRTVYDWINAHDEFAARIARARTLGFDAIAEDTIDLIDEKPEYTATEFGQKIDSGYVQWQKNRVEQRMKLLAKWSPRYSDKPTATPSEGSKDSKPADGIPAAPEYVLTTDEEMPSAPIL